MQALLLEQQDGKTLASVQTLMREFCRPAVLKVTPA